jgi:hypothetical protein
MREDDTFHRFAAAWIAAWNSRQVDRILTHYAEEVVYRSPFVARLGGSPDGLLVGKAALRDYVRAGLRRYPDLRFHLRRVYPGADSVVIEYDGVGGLVAAEVFVLDAAARAGQVFCHYRPGEAPSNPELHRTAAAQGD